MSVQTCAATEVAWSTQDLLINANDVPVHAWSKNPFMEMTESLDEPFNDEKEKGQQLKSLLWTRRGYLCSHKTKKPKFELHDFFGQLLRIFVVDMPDSLQATENSEQMTWQGEEDEDLSPKQWVYAVIHSVKVIEMDNFGINYYEELGPIEVVDLSTIQCVIGHICDCDHLAIIDHSGWSGSHLTLWQQFHTEKETGLGQGGGGGVDCGLAHGTTANYFERTVEVEVEKDVW